MLAKLLGLLFFVGIVLLTVHTCMPSLAPAYQAKLRPVLEKDHFLRPVHTSSLPTGPNQTVYDVPMVHVKEKTRRLCTITTHDAVTDVTLSCVFDGSITR